MSAYPSFILHQRPFKNTSRIVEFFTYDFGRLTAVANGVNAAKSPWSGILRAFSLVEINFTGNKDLKTLTAAEATQEKYQLNGPELYCGFYLNELLLYLLPKEDPHPKSFRAYKKTLDLLKNAQDYEFALRKFEYTFLRDIGLGLDFDDSSNKIVDNSNYVFNDGLVLSDKIPGISGKCLRQLKLMNADDKCRKMLRNFMRDLITNALEGREIKSRKMLQEYINHKCS